SWLTQTFVLILAKTDKLTQDSNSNLNRIYRLSAGSYFL
ncbi:MAG: hypothetical protein ACJAZ3_000908, partial [Sphingobacteriales bacterium]